MGDTENKVVLAHKLCHKLPFIKFAEIIYQNIHFLNINILTYLNDHFRLSLVSYKQKKNSKKTREYTRMRRNGKKGKGKETQKAHASMLVCK